VVVVSDATSQQRQALQSTNLDAVCDPVRSGGAVLFRLAGVARGVAIGGLECGFVAMGWAN
jgi:hypothetical protein